MLVLVYLSLMHLTNSGLGLQDQVWVWLAGEDIKDQESAMDYCRNFLTFFVKTSTKPQLVWGPEEQRDEQGLSHYRHLGQHNSEVSHCRAPGAGP